MYDGIIVGGSNAGLSAALMLGRSRRRVVVLDHEQPRNAPSKGVHSFLSRDGILPADLRRIGREQLQAYASVEVRFAEATSARAIANGFEVTLADGVSVQARKLLLATGVYDELPEIEGFTELWGSSVFHCPYCHGWEMRDLPLAIHARGAAAIEMAQLLRGWSHDLIVCTDGPAELTDDERGLLARHDIGLREEPIARLEARDGALYRIHFATGAPLERQGLFYRPGQRQRSTLPAQLGCAFVGEGMLAHLLRVDAMGETSVPGVYAAGDIVTPMQQAIQAAASGALAGAAINRRLLHEEFV